MTGPAKSVTLVAALARNRAIGLRGRMPWHLPAELAHFRSTTWGKPVIMGRRTFEAIGRALPGRQNIVVTGGGSRIRGLDTVIQQKLADDGFESPKVKLAGPEYKRFVAVGALKAARSAREDQWQHLLA